MSKLKLRAVFVPRFGSQSLRTPVKEYELELPPSTSKDKNGAVREKNVKGQSEVRKVLPSKSAKTTHHERQTPSKKRKNVEQTQISPVLAVTRGKEKSVCRGGEAVRLQPTSQSSSSQGKYT